MPTFTPQFLDTLRSRVSIATVIGQTVKLTRKGRDFWGCCPFHHEKTPSFVVNDEKEFYHCFGCGQHGDVVDFAMKALKMNFVDAVEMLAEQAGMEIPKSSPQEIEQEKKRGDLYDVLEKACLFFQEQLYKPAGREGLFYLQRRGLTDETIKRFRLGFAPNGNALRALLEREKVPVDHLRRSGVISFPDDGRQPFDYFRDRVMFPISDKRGRVIAFGGRVLDNGEPKYLNSPETPLFSKSDTLYAAHLAAEQARKMQEILVVEGYMDVIALHSAGITRAVASCGTALTERQIEQLWKYAPEPICCFDGDLAGIRAATRAANRVLPLLKAGKSLRFMTLPDELDPDEFIKERGKPAFEDFMRGESRPLSKQLWQMLLQGKELDTPERKAVLEKEINDTLSKITDESVRNFYRQEFRAALWDVTVPLKKGGKKQAPVSAVIHPRPRPEAGEARMLLAYLLLFPEIAAAYLEELAAFEPSDAFLNEAFKDVVNGLAEDPDLTAERLEEYFRMHQKDRVYKTVAGELEILKRKRPTPPEAAQDILGRLENERQKALKAELAELAGLIAAETDAGQAALLWERYQKLASGQSDLAQK